MSEVEYTTYIVEDDAEDYVQYPPDVLTPLTKTQLWGADTMQSPSFCANGFKKLKELFCLA
jgi:hypothetical protein